MTDDHLDAFVREAEESLVDLNNSLLALEDDPSDEEAMDRIFRTAHTLKGNFSAMGFEETGRLAHAIEDLLDEIRQGRIAVTPAVMDHVFEGVDLIEAALEGIEAEGEPSTDPGATIESIRSLIEGDDAPEPSEPPDGEEGARPDLGIEPEALEGVDPPVVRAGVELGDAEMKGVDGMLVLEAATDALDLVAADPDPGAIRDGDFGDGFELFFAEDPAAVESTLEDIGQVESAAVVDVTDAIPGVDAGEGSPGALEADDPGASAADEDGATDAGDTGAEPDDDGDGAPQDDGDGSTASVDEIKSIRVDVDQLDELYNLVEQLVTSRIKLRRAVEAGDLAGASEGLDELDKLTSGLQGTVMDMRLIPLKKAVNTFPRMVRDLARSQGKEIDFDMEGTDVELDRTILDEMSDPLMHVLRNAVDHGIEPPDVREGKGKPREGTIRLRAERERDHVSITVEDDGAGLDADELREKAREEGVRTGTELDAMDDSDVYDLIFHPGFSTSEEVTDVSGRGVGMDVVHSTVNRLDGSVSVESEPDEGTAVTLRLPVTVAIVRVLFVRVGDREYGVPIKTIDEITRAGGAEMVNGDEVIDHDDSIYPVVRLREALHDESASGPGRNGDGMLLRIREEERQVALHCDAVERQEEVVIKPFEGELGDVPGLSGTAVIGDGNVVPILDVGTI